MIRRGDMKLNMDSELVLEPLLLLTDSISVKIKE